MTAADLALEQELKYCDQCFRSEIALIISGTGSELLPIKEYGDGVDRLMLCEDCARANAQTGSLRE